MGKIAFIFPGQGAQYRNMARDFYEQIQASRSIFEEASRVSGMSIESLCFEDEQRLNQTRYTQPALFTANCAVLKAVEQLGLKPDMTAGLSLGEYCALTAAGVFSFEDAVQVVCSRGIYMEEAVPEGTGAMMAILTRKEIPMEDICEKVPGQVVVANYNCPGQRVISGDRQSVETAAEKLLAAGAARALPLKVSGPFHSPLLETAGKQLFDRLEGVKMNAPSIPFVSNVTAQEEREPEKIRELLGRQVCSPVYWQQSMEYMIANGADTFVEIGPGKTLTNFLKKIDKSVKTYHVEKIQDLEELKNIETAG